MSDMFEELFKPKLITTCPCGAKLYELEAPSSVNQQLVIKFIESHKDHKEPTK